MSISLKIGTHGKCKHLCTCTVCKDQVGQRMGRVPIDSNMKYFLYLHLCYYILVYINVHPTTGSNKLHFLRKGLP